MPHGHLESISQAFLTSLDDVDVDGISDGISLRVESFLREYEDQHSDLILKLFISDIRMRHMVKSLYLDLFKYRTFHSYDEYDKPLNRFKKAAYFVKWFIKIKPLMALEVGGNKRSVNLSLQINETFSLVYATTLSQLNASLITDNTRDRITYGLAYREYNETQFTFWLESLHEHG